MSVGSEFTITCIVSSFYALLSKGFLINLSCLVHLIIALNGSLFLWSPFLSSLSV